MSTVSTHLKALANCYEIKVHKSNASWLCKELEKNGVKVTDNGTIDDTPLVVLHAYPANDLPIDSVAEILKSHNEIEVT